MTSISHTFRILLIIFPFSSVQHATCPVCRKNVISDEEAQAAQQAQDDIFRPTFLNIIPYAANLAHSATTTTTTSSSSSSGASSGLLRSGLGSARHLGDNGGGGATAYVFSSLSSTPRNPPNIANSSNNTIATVAEEDETEPSRRSTLRSNRHLSVHIRRIAPSDAYNSTVTGHSLSPRSATNTASSNALPPTSSVSSSNTTTSTTTDQNRRSARLGSAHAPIRVHSRIVPSSSSGSTLFRSSHDAQDTTANRSRSSRASHQSTSSTTTSPPPTSGDSSSSSSSSSSSLLSSDISTRIGQMMERLISARDVFVARPATSQSTTGANTADQGSNSSSNASPLMPTISVRFGIGSFESLRNPTHPPLSSSTSNAASASEHVSGRAATAFSSDDDDQHAAEHLFSFALNRLAAASSSSAATAATSMPRRPSSGAASNLAHMDARSLAERRLEARREIVSGERRALRNRLRQDARDGFRYGNTANTTANNNNNNSNNFASPQARHR